MLRRCWEDVVNMLRRCDVGKMLERCWKMFGNMFGRMFGKMMGTC